MNSPNTSSQPKVAALIGAGMVSATHVAACADASDRVRLKGILSRCGDTAQRLASKASDLTNSAVLTFNSVEQIAADPEVDFVIIATPPDVRGQLIAPLAHAGKHILLEKPIGRTLAEAQHMVQLCNDAGVALGVVFQHRAREASVKASQLIRSNTLGKLGLVDLNVPWWRDQSYYDEPGRGTYQRDGGGVLISQAIHTIDLALSFTGPVSSVVAMAKTSLFHEMESEDFVVAGLAFDNGAVGSLKASTASYPGGAESIDLHFEHASLCLQGGVCQINWRDGRVETLGKLAGSGGGADPMAFSHDLHQRIIENFVDSLNRNVPLYTTGDQALMAHQLIHAIVESATNSQMQRVAL